MPVSTDICDTTIDAAVETQILQSRAGDAGGLATFTGVVRGEGEVSCLRLSHYPGFTENEVKAIAEKAATTWPLTACRIIHRVGDMSPGDVIVFVGAASKHRRAALEAVDFMMDYLKSEAPFWKQERRGDGMTWIEPRRDDMKDKERWEH